MAPRISAVRAARLRLGLTQGDLARAAGVSLATVQNVEAGRANPALRTLERILAPLGLELDVRAAPADWPALVALGLPLSGPSRDGTPRDAPSLGLHVARAAAELRSAPGSAAAARRRDALHALVLAAALHFPDVAGRWAERSDDVRLLLDGEVDGRVVKLARVARAALSEYL